MGELALSNLGGVGPLPGLSLQFLMELLAGLFLASLRIGAFLIASPFFGGSSVPLQVRICSISYGLMQRSREIVTFL